MPERADDILTVGRLKKLLEQYQDQTLVFGAHIEVSEDGDFQWYMVDSRPLKVGRGDVEERTLYRKGDQYYDTPLSNEAEPEQAVVIGHNGETKSLDWDF